MPIGQVSRNRSSGGKRDRFKSQQLFLKVSRFCPNSGPFGVDRATSCRGKCSRPSTLPAIPFDNCPSNMRMMLNPRRWHASLCAVPPRHSAVIRARRSSFSSVVACSQGDVSVNPRRSVGPWSVYAVIASQVTRCRKHLFKFMAIVKLEPGCAFNACKPQCPTIQKLDLAFAVREVEPSIRGTPVVSEYR